MKPSICQVGDLLSDALKYCIILHDISYLYDLTYIFAYNADNVGGTRGVMVMVAGIGHGDTSSNPGLIAFHIALIPLGKVWIQLFSFQLWVNSRAD